MSKRLLDIKFEKEQQLKIEEDFINVEKVDKSDKSVVVTPSEFS